MRERAFDPKVAAILVFACLVRLLGISSRPIWYDEAFSILFSEKGLSAMLYGTLAPTGAGSADIHPLGYYSLLWLWMKIFGESLVAARLLSIAAGLVSVYLIYLIALNLLADKKTARLSMLFAAAAPFQIHYAQEIRMYSFLALWLLLATYSYQRAARTRQRRWWILFSISAACAQYTHNLAAFYLLALAILPILQRDFRALRGMTLAGMGALLLYLPWAIQLPAQFSKVQNAYWVERPDISKLFTLLLVYLTNTPLPAGLVAPALALALTLVIIGVVQTLRDRRSTGGGEGPWLLYLSFAPPLFLFLFSQWRAVYIERALVPSGAIFCIWLAWMILNTNLQRSVRYFLFGLLGVSSLLGIYEHLTYRGFPYGPYQALDASLHQRALPQDAIVHANKLSLLPALLFDRDLPQSFIGDPAGSRTDTLAPATQRVLKISAVSDIAAATFHAERVWYVIYQRAIEEVQAAGQPTYPDIEYLNSHFSLDREEDWDGLRVFLYTKQP
jgi:4-amino-4-deoxy-L-arabinose transferase-like glycosyltransferase